MSVGVASGPIGEKLPRTVATVMAEDDLERFRRPVSEHRSVVEAELRAGWKKTHWMWFMFPQLRKLGSSEPALLYGLVYMDEAVRYLADEQLGQTYATLVGIVHDQVIDRGVRLDELFDPPDDLKLVSSLTLFSAAAGQLGLAELEQQCAHLLQAAAAQGYGQCSTTIECVSRRA